MGHWGDRTSARPKMTLPQASQHKSRYRQRHRDSMGIYYEKQCSDLSFALAVAIVRRYLKA